MTAMLKAKKLLLIMQLNQTLLFVNNTKSKTLNLGLQSMNLKYDDKVDHYDILYRKGKGQFLEYIFNTEKDNIDLAIWSNLDHQLTQAISQRYFGRYYRQLLFILATNRALYAKPTDSSQTSLKIPKQLTNVYSRFSGYSQLNTLVISSQSNTIQSHKQNDVKIPSFHPLKPNYNSDPACYGIAKYIKGIMIVVNNKQSTDIRGISVTRPIDKMFDRFGKRMFKNPEYW